MRKFFVLLFLVCITQEIMLPMAYATTSTSTPIVSENDAAITAFLVQKGLIQKQTSLAGYRLNSTISRGEMAKLMGGVYNDFLSDDVQFTACSGKVFGDVKTGGFCPYIELLASKWLLNTTNKNFRVDDKVSRAEFITMLLRAYGKKPKSLSALRPVIDVPPTSSHAPYISYALENKLTTLTGKNFFPDTAVTRREVFTFISRLLPHN